MIPTIDDIRAAAERIKGIAVRTPLLRSDALDEATGAKVWVKAECLQRGGAFKMRGATNAIAALAPVVRKRGVIAFSSGNHAIAVSSAAKLFGVGAVIVMRKKAPQIERPYRTFGYPFVPLLYIVLAGLFIIDLAYLAPSTSGIGYLLVFTGIPVYLVWRKRSN